MESNMTSFRNLTFKLMNPGSKELANESRYGGEDYSFGFPDNGRYIDSTTFDFNDLGVYNDTPTGFPCSLFNDSILCNMSISNNSTNGTIPVATDDLALWLDVVLAVLAGIVSLVTILGNVLVIMAFYLERSIRQPTNYFIASLAVSDLLIGVFSMNFYTLYLLMGTWPLGEIVCDLWLSLDFTVCLASQYTVFFITVDRFCSVKIPAKYRNWRTEKKVLVMVATTWIIPTVVFFTSIIGYQYFVGERTVLPGYCFVQFQENPLFSLLLTIGYYWTTLFVMCGLYTGIYKVALTLQRKSEAKHKKMTSLVSMAGQTMSKIGIGMSRAPEAKNNNTCNESTTFASESAIPLPLESTRVTTTTTFTNEKQPKDDERSSSPAFPSDTDNDSHSPKRCNSDDSKCRGKKHRQGSKGRESKKDKEKKPNKETRELRKDKTNSGESNLKVPVTIPAIPGSNSNTPPTDSGYHTVSVHSCDPPDIAAGQVNLAETQNSSIDIPQSPVDKNVPSSLELPSSSIARPEDIPGNSPNICLAATPERIEGVGYIDQESLKSLQSSDNLKMLTDILPKPNGNPIRREEPSETSPIWKKRDSLSFDNIDDLKNPCIRIQDPSSSSNSVRQMPTMVDTIDDKTVTKLAKNDELQPLNASSSKYQGKRGKKHKLGSQLVSSLAKTVGSRKRGRSKKKKVPTATLR